ncbi:MAG TPA: hypothetical protein VN026_15990 [Bacteroidia bacterium]|jgi:hypothetical protein|nr:hypothetical protein [Bacteroidia bacterium]
MRTNNIDLTNTENFDNNVSGFTGGVPPYKTNKRYSNFDWGSLAQESAQITQQLISSNTKTKTALDAQVKSICGNKPLTNITGKKAKWQQCHDKVIADNEKKNAPQYQPTPAPVYNIPKPPPVNNTILGMPKGLAIGLGIILFSGLVIGGIVVVKKIKANKASNINSKNLKTA